MPWAKGKRVAPVTLTCYTVGATGGPAVHNPSKAMSQSAYIVDTRTGVVIRADGARLVLEADVSPRDAEILETSVELHPVFASQTREIGGRYGQQLAAIPPADTQDLSLSDTLDKVAEALSNGGVTRAIQLVRATGRFIPEWAEF